MNESTPLFRTLSAVVAVILVTAAATAGLILGAFAFAMFSIVVAMSRLKILAVSGRRIPTGHSTPAGIIIEGRYKDLSK